MLKTTEVISEPVRRTIFVGNRSYFLSFPKIKFRIKFSAVKEGCSFFNLSIETCIDGKYYNIPILPNTFPRFMCLPKVDQIFQSIEELQSYIINLFWTSKFTDINDKFLDFGAIIYFLEYTWPEIEICYSCLPYDKFNEYFDSWERKTKENPKWVPGLDFFKVK